METRTITTTNNIQDGVKRKRKRRRIDDILATTDKQSRQTNKQTNSHANEAHDEGIDFILVLL
jgi:hypothetical protein